MYLLIAFPQLVFNIAQKALTVIIVFHKLLMSLEILRMLNYMGELLIAERTAGYVHSTIQVRAQINKRICEHRHILGSQYSLRSLRDST